MTFSLQRRGLELHFRTAELAERTWLNDAYLRVRLRGDNLTGFDSPGSDDHMRLFFPSAAEGSIAWTGSIDELRAQPSREYTPLEWDQDWLDVEFAIHGEPGDRGIAAEWAASAPLGSIVGVGGPRGSMIIDGTPDAWLLAGDETAVPAIRRFAGSMPEYAVGRVLVEVPDAAHELSIAVPGGVTLEYVHRGHAPGGSALAARLDAITAADRPIGDVIVFIASEQSIVKPGRALALDRWELDVERIVVKGYWKLGDTEFHAPH